MEEQKARHMDLVRGPFQVKETPAPINLCWDLEFITESHLADPMQLSHESSSSRNSLAQARKVSFAFHFAKQVSVVQSRAKRTQSSSAQSYVSTAIPISIGPEYQAVLPEMIQINSNEAQQRNDNEINQSGCSRENEQHRNGGNWQGNGSDSKTMSQRSSIEEIKKRLDSQVLIRPKALNGQLRLAEMAKMIRPQLEPNHQKKSLKLLSFFDFDIEAVLFMAKKQKINVQCLLDSL